jgi:hypothetical protein
MDPAPPTSKLRSCSRSCSGWIIRTGFTDTHGFGVMLTLIWVPLSMAPVIRRSWAVCMLTLPNIVINNLHLARGVVLEYSDGSWSCWSYVGSSKSVLG